MSTDKSSSKFNIVEYSDILRGNAIANVKVILPSDKNPKSKYPYCNIYHW